MFRAEAAQFIDSATDAGVACPAFGAIMPPAFYEPAKRWQRHCYEHGFAGLHWPAAFGGQGLSVEHNQVWNAECARRGVTPYMNFQGVVLAGGALVRFGTDEQKARFLRSTLSADIVWCQLFSEPEAGSDLVSLRTRAEADGADGWRVTGQKVWSSTAQLADWAILLARTNPDQPGHRGISFLLLDMSDPGVEVRPLKQMTGDTEFCEVFLDGATVAADGLLGTLGEGWGVATSVLSDERAAAAAAGIGLRRQLDRLHQHSETLSRAERDRVLDLMVRGDALAHLLDRSGGDPRLGPLTKLGRSELGMDVATAQLHGHGPAAMLSAGEAAGDVDAFLYAPGMKFGGGTSEIQRNLVGERLLGLPREPRA